MRAGLPRGYRMRTATFDDIPAVVAVGKACDLQDIGELDVFEDWVHDDGCVRASTHRSTRGS